MANPDRGEVDYYFEDKHYTLKFSNAGRRVAEAELNMEAPEITRKLSTGGGARILTALFYGATRKFHARDFPNMAFCDQHMDAIEDAGQEAAIELYISVAAAYLRVDKADLKRQILGEEPDDEASEELPKEEPKNEKK